MCNENQMKQHVTRSNFTNQHKCDEMAAPGQEEKEVDYFNCDPYNLSELLTKADQRESSVDASGIVAISPTSECNKVDDLK